MCCRRTVPVLERVPCTRALGPGGRGGRGHHGEREWRRHRRPLHRRAQGHLRQQRCPSGKLNSYIILCLLPVFKVLSFIFISLFQLQYYKLTVLIWFCLESFKRVLINAAYTRDLIKSKSSSLFIIVTSTNEWRRVYHVRSLLSIIIESISSTDSTLELFHHIRWIKLVRERLGTPTFVVSSADSLGEALLLKCFTKLFMHKNIHWIV